MESLDLIEPFLSDLLGAEARTRPRRRRRLRAAALAAAAIAALAVPAWATGLLGHVFPLDSGAPYAHFTYQHGGRYVLARGSLPGRGSYRLVAFRADFPPGGPRHAIPFRAGPAICVMLEINRPVAPGAPHGITTGFASCSGRADLARPAFWLAEGGLGPIGRGPRLRWGIVPSSVALVHVTLASGRHIDVRPNRFDPRAEHAAGFPFEFGYLAFAPPQGEKFRGLVAVDDHGRVVGRVGLSTRTPPGTPVRQSPAL